MEFHVGLLLREATGARRAERIIDRCATDDGRSVDVQGDVGLLRTDAGILATAGLRTSVDGACSRCLAPAHMAVRLEIEEEYHPTVDIATGVPLPPRDDPTPFLIDVHHILDLSEAVRQQLILAEPMQLLCRPDCAGLCAACGEDRNRGRCQCPPAETDGRWAALRELAEKSRG